MIYESDSFRNFIPCLFHYRLTFQQEFYLFPVLSAALNYPQKLPFIHKVRSDSTIYPLHYSPSYDVKYLRKRNV